MRLVLAAIVLLLALPPAAAQLKPHPDGWGAKGEWEPDTRLDAAGGWMTLHPDITPVVGATNADPGNAHKVYFNAFQGTSSPVLSTSTAPNLASLGTRHAATPHQSFAMLGVWKDCNRDGYVGLGDQGLWEYPASALAATAGIATCKPQTVPTPIPRGWMPVHNHGSWVIEFIPIVWDVAGPTQKDANPWNVNDPGARVWGDFGLPGDPGRFVCWISNVPEGTYHTVGAIADYVDCFTAHRFRDNVAAATGLTGAQDEWESLRATRNPWGEVGDGSMAYVFDCSDGDGDGRPDQAAHQQATPTIGVGVSNPRAAPAVDPAGSPAGTANETASALDDCDRSDNTQGSNVEWEHSVARAPYSHEGSATVNQAGDKTQTDAWMNPAEGSRPPLTPAAAATNALGRSTSKDPTRATDVEGFWNGRSIGTTYNSVYTAGRDNVDPVKHWSYYAYVSPAVVTAYGLALPKGAATGVYGAEACGADAGLPGAPNRGGWTCDPAGWWPGTILEKEVNNGVAQTYQVRVGQPYNLRDVDCFDESVDGAREAGATYGAVTGTGCA